MKTEKIDFVGIETKEIQMCETEQEEKEGYLAVETSKNEYGHVFLRVEAKFPEDMINHIFVRSHMDEFVRVATIEDMSLNAVEPKHTLKETCHTVVSKHFISVRNANVFLLKLIEDVRKLNKDIKRTHIWQPMINGKVLI